MSKLAEKATIRRRNADRVAIKYMAVTICILLFSMIFIFAMLTGKEEHMNVAILDATGEVHKGEVMPFGKAKIYHEYLVNMAIDGLYQRDGEGVLNNYYEVIANPAMISKRNKMVAENAMVFKQKKIIQTARIIQFKVDQITNLKLDMKVQVQVIRKSHSLGGDQIEGQDMRVVSLRFERNENMKTSVYRPWLLTAFKEWKDGEND